MKRFYKLVSVRQEGQGYAICLDGKPVKIPSGQRLTAPNEALADAIMQEWAAQEEHIIPDDMPLTQILSTKIGRVAQEREAMTQAVMKYLDTDLLCYRTEDPPELAKMQRESWDPWLAWFGEKFGASLETTTALSAIKQSEKAHKQALHYIKSIDDNVFTVLQLVTSLSGSLVLALAFVWQVIGLEEIFDAAYVEENHKAQLYNEDLYGPDPAEEKKQRAVKRDLAAAAKFLEYLN